MKDRIDTLRTVEIEAGANCSFLSLVQELLLLEMLVSNIFSPIKDSDQ
jgi:hypothetical protein